MPDSARVRIVKVLRERGPMHLDEIEEELGDVPRRSIEVRLSELVAGQYPWFRVRRVCLGVYELVSRGDA